MKFWSRANIFILVQYYFPTNSSELVSWKSRHLLKVGILFFEKSENGEQLRTQNFVKNFSQKTENREQLRPFPSCSLFSLKTINYFRGTPVLRFYTCILLKIVKNIFVKKTRTENNWDLFQVVPCSHLKRQTFLTRFLWFLRF